MRQRKLTDQQRIDAVTAYLAGAGSYQAVEEYQSGQGTQRDICLKYNIRARTQLRNWIRQYGSGDLSSAAPPRANPRKKKTIPGHKTTLDERINIVSHCLANDRNYELSARTHSVSYQQVYSWVKNMTPTDSTASSTDAADIAIQCAWIPSNVQNTKTRSSRTRSPASRQKCSR